MRTEREMPMEQPLDALKAFQDEMWELKAEEESGEAETAHFQELNPDELTDEDRGIWEKLQNRTLALEEFKAYRAPVFRGNHASRKHFAAFIGNKLQIQLLEDEAREK